METHPLCSIFPEMDDASFADLCTSIAKHGIRQPVYVHKGKIVDGRHRERAGLLLGCEIPYVEWGGGDDEAALIEFVADCNLHRRDMTPSQRAAVGVEIKRRLEVEYIKRRNTGKKIEPKTGEPSVNVDTRSNSRDEAAARAGVSAGYIHAAEKIHKADPELFDDVKQGRVTISEAKRRISPAPTTAEPAIRNPPVVADLVSEPDDAETAALKKKAKRFGTIVKRYKAETPGRDVYLVHLDGVQWIKDADGRCDRAIRDDDDGDASLASCGVARDIFDLAERISETALAVSPSPSCSPISLADLIKYKTSLKKIADAFEAAANVDVEAK